MEATKVDIQSAMETFKEEVSKITKAAALVSSSSPKMGTHAQGSMVQRVTYVEAVNRRLPPSHLSMLARSRIQGKQVLVNKDPEVASNQLDGLNEHELVAKADEAIRHMSAQLQQGPVEPRRSGPRGSTMVGSPMT